MSDEYAVVTGLRTLNRLGQVETPYYRNRMGQIALMNLDSEGLYVNRNW